jgi:hypothetical protein
LGLQHYRCIMSAETGEPRYWIMREAKFVVVALHCRACPNGSFA